MAKTYDTDEILDKAVLNILLGHVGFAHRIGRWELAEQVFEVHIPEALRTSNNYYDRETRDSVERLRDAGHLIGDMGDGKGRWIAETEEEFWNFYSYYVRQIVSKGRTARAMKRAAKLKFPNLEQPSLFDKPIPPEVVEFDEMIGEFA